MKTHNLLWPVLLIALVTMAILFLQNEKDDTSVAGVIKTYKQIFRALESFNKRYYCVVLPDGGIGNIDVGTLVALKQEGFLKKIPGAEVLKKMKTLEGEAAQAKEQVVAAMKRGGMAVADYSLSGKANEMSSVVSMVGAFFGGNDNGYYIGDGSGEVGAVYGDQYPDSVLPLDGVSNVKVESLRLLKGGNHLSTIPDTLALEAMNGIHDEPSTNVYFFAVVLAEARKQNLCSKPILGEMTIELKHVETPRRKFKIEPEPVVGWFENKSPGTAVSGFFDSFFD